MTRPNFNPLVPTPDTPAPWTPDRARNELPRVLLDLGPKGRALFGKAVVPARVGGRLNSFASVTPDTDYVPWACCWEFSWEAIARAADTGTPLHVV